MATRPAIMQALIDFAAVYPNGHLGYLLNSRPDAHGNPDPKLLATQRQWERALHGVEDEELAQLVNDWIDDRLNEEPPANAGALRKWAAPVNHDGNSPAGPRTECTTCGGRTVLDVAVLGRDVKGTPGAGPLRRYACPCGDCSPLRGRTLAGARKPLRDHRELKQAYERAGLVMYEHFAFSRPDRPNTRGGQAYRALCKSVISIETREGPVPVGRVLGAHRRQHEQWAKTHGRE